MLWITDANTKKTFYWGYRAGTDWELDISNKSQFKKNVIGSNFKMNIKNTIVDIGHERTIYRFKM